MQQIRVSWAPSLRRAELRRNLFFQKFRCCTAWHSRLYHKKILYNKTSQCLCINLGTVQRIRKELDESTGDYERTASRKSLSGRFDKKRTPEFVGKIQVMIYNDPSKLIRPIDRTWKSLCFLSGRQCMKTIVKRGNFFFYQGSWRMRRKTSLQSFSTNSIIPSNRHKRKVSSKIK